MSPLAGTQEEQRRAADGAAPLSRCLPPEESSQVATVPATFIAAVGGNDAWWRCLAPAKAIGARTQIILEAEMEKALLAPNDDTAFPWTFDPVEVESSYPGQEGTAVFIRPDPPRAVHAQKMREQGVLTVSEVDDNYMANPRLNIFQRQSGYDKTDQAKHIRSMAACDRIVFSTEYLRDLYLRYFKDAFNVKTERLPEMFVCRNHIDVADWPEPIPRSGPLRVGWMGSPSHIWDIALCRPALMQAQAFGCSTHLIGYNPAHPNGAQYGEAWPGQSHASKRMIGLWKQLRYQFTDWQKPADYHRQALPFDIGLCPLRTDEATLGKSDVKAIEYGISGAAVIAQNNLVYNRTLVHGETALLVNDPQEMVDAIKLLTFDEPLRMRLVNNLRQYIYEERGLKQMREEWGAAVTPS